MRLSSENQSLGLMSREDMLRELELLPVWQLRQPLPAMAKAETLPDVAIEAVIDAPESPVHEQSVIEVTSTDAVVIQTIVTESYETPAFAAEVTMPKQADSDEQPESYVSETVHTDTSIQALPLRFVLCENGHYGFLMAPDDQGAETQAAETLFKNMLRAMQVNGRVDVTDTVENIFATHRPKVLLSMGAAPANQLLGQAHAVDEWRSLQQQSPLLYAEIPVIVTYHPAHLLEHTADKAHAWRDLCTAMKLTLS